MDDQYVPSVWYFGFSIVMEHHKKSTASLESTVIRPSSQSEDNSTDDAELIPVIQPAIPEKHNYTSYKQDLSLIHI